MLKTRLTTKIIEKIVRFNAPLNEGAKDYFLNGYCYWYARILQERFRPWFEAEIMYNPVQNHFACRIKDIYCDASGILDVSPEDWVSWTSYIELEPKGAARIYRDCVWHMTEEEWKKLPTSYRETPWLL